MYLCIYTYLYIWLFLCALQNEEFTVYSTYAENYMEAVIMVDKLVHKPGAPEYLGVSIYIYVHVVYVSQCVYVCV